MKCSKCRKAHDSKSRYCQACHAAYMREWRKENPTTAGQSLRNTIRARASNYARRHKFVFVGCADCRGAHPLQLHHPDYSQGHRIVPLCAICHNKRHRSGRGESLEGSFDLDKVVEGLESSPLIISFEV